MNIAPWFWFAIAVLICWGIVGLLQKLSTNYISAESSLIWVVVGFVLLEPFFYPGKSVFTYSHWNLAWALLGGLLNALGAWALFAAMKNDGKASVVAPFTALYPLVVIILAPLILHEPITALQFAGVTCSLVAVVLLSSGSELPSPTRETTPPKGPDQDSVEAGDEALLKFVPPDTKPSA